MNTSVIGAGSWGSSFARYLGTIGLPTRLWIREEDIYSQALTTRENATFLPGFRFPEPVSFTDDLRGSAEFGDVLFIAVPSQFCRAVYTRIAPVLRRGQIVVSLTKGFDMKTQMRMSQVMEEVFRPHVRPRVAVLSGPSFAKEVAAGQPTALVVASRDTGAAREVQHLISSLTIRAYTSSDVTGVEVAGALKNVIAIAAGIADALKFGLNTRAALITRGLVEITNLGLALGARRETFCGPRRGRRPRPDLHRGAQPQPPRRPRARQGPVAPRDPGRDEDGRRRGPYDRLRPPPLPRPRRGDAHFRTDLPGPLPGQGPQEGRRGPDVPGAQG